MMSWHGALRIVILNLLVIKNMDMFYEQLNEIDLIVKLSLVFVINASVACTMYVLT